MNGVIRKASSVISAILRICNAEHTSEVTQWTLHAVKLIMELRDAKTDEIQGRSNGL